MSLNIIFAGSPDFALPSFQTLLDSPHRIIAVYTQPDKPAGRGRKLALTPVKRLAQQYELPVYQPTTLTDPVEQQRLRQLAPDLMVVVAYGLLLPTAVLAIPRFGCINVHASLLPRWRGAAPIQQAILAGDQQTGISIMQMEAGLDTGPVLQQVTCPITVEDTSETLFHRLASLGNQALLDTIESLATGRAEQQLQDETQASYAPKITKQSAAIDWQQAAVVIERAIRAFYPWPIAHTGIATGSRIRIYQAFAAQQTHDKTPGTLLAVDASGITVATGEGVLIITKLQLPGGKPLLVEQLIHGQHEWLQPGTRLGIVNAD